MSDSGRTAGAAPPSTGDPGPPGGPPAGVPPSGSRAAALVAGGILVSRLLGLVRQRLFAHYLGVGDAADAFTAAFKLPNFLQNLFGEGVLSASFIPVYARLHQRGDDAARRELAGAVLALLLLLTALIVLLGVTFAPQLARVVGALGYTGAKFELTVRIVRILFPGAALLALSAWSLGVLNSHRRFFLSYASAALWNVAMIATLLGFGPRSSETELVVWLAWGSVAGSLLQFAAQLPLAWRLLGGLRVRWATRSEEVRTVLRNFGPVFLGRGVAQVSGFVDASIVSLLGTGPQAILGYAQALYLLPVSLFGMSVSAAELPELARLSTGGDEAGAALRQRLEDGLRRIAFFVVPSAVAFLAFGDLIAGVIYGFQSGKFGEAEARWVWGVLAGAAVGLVASTLGRLYSSAFYALGDTRTPFRYAALRVLVSMTLGASLALLGPKVLGVDARFGVAGITIASGIAGWLEFAMLRRSLSVRTGRIGVPTRLLALLWSGALLGAAAGWGARLLNRGLPPLLHAALVLGVFGMVYWVFTWRTGVSEAADLRRRIFRRAS